MQLSPELLNQKKKLQTEVMFKDSDIKKLSRAKLQAEVEVRDFKRKQMQLQSDLLLKENELKRIDAQIMQFQNELIKLKHKMNNLGR
jgi:septal ring factor EnvC (AmiA/AmiB activator)